MVRGHGGTAGVEPRTPMRSSADPLTRPAGPWKIFPRGRIDGDLSRTLMQSCADTEVYRSCTVDLPETCLEERFAGNPSRAALQVRADTEKYRSRPDGHSETCPRKRPAGDLSRVVMQSRAGTEEYRS